MPDQVEPMFSGPPGSEVRQRIREYFFGEAQKRTAVLTALFTSLKVGPIVVGGTALWIAAIAIKLYEPLGFVEAGFSNLLRVETPSLLFGVGVLVLGALLFTVGRGGRVLDGVIANPWRYAVWLIGVPLLLLASSLVQARLGNQALGVALELASILLIPLGLRLTQQAAMPLEEVEREIDSALDADIEQHFTSAAGHLVASSAGDAPFPGYGQRFVRLLGFPDAGKLAGVAYRVRPGHDGRPRMTPHGFAVLAFGDEQALAFDGAIDVATGELVYYRVQEFTYAEIASVSFESQPAEAEARREAAAMVQKLQMPGMRQAARRRQRFAIGLHGESALSVVVRDDSMFEPVRGAESIPLTSWADIRDTWRNLNLLRRKALAAARS